LQTLELSSRNLSVLHLSPEIGIQKKLNKLFINCNYRISDYGDESTLNIDIQKAIAFKFDIIICSHILEHVDNDELALRNLYNSLNPNGMVLFLVPLHKEIDYTIQDVNIKSPLEKKETYGLEDHVRQYGTIDFQELLKANFELKIFQVSDLDYHKLGLAKDSRLYIGLRN
jgi:predicted SAM-dependent methyltransferase